MKSSRNIRNSFRTAAKHCRILSLFCTGIVIVVLISGVATAQSPSAAPADAELFTQELRVAFKFLR
jgi:hypothetical protein